MKAELRWGLEQKTWEAVHEKGKLSCMRREDISFSLDGCFWWLSGWKQSPTHTVGGMLELCEQLLPTRLYACHKTHTDTPGEVMCRLCNKAPEMKVSPMSWLIVKKIIIIVIIIIIIIIII